MEKLNIEELAGNKIGFRNFSGKPGRYNKSGERNFVIFLDEEEAYNLESLGWTVKRPAPKTSESGETFERQPYINVKVNMNSYRPPKIVMVTMGNLNRLDEETLNTLDYAEIESADIILNPYNWELPDGRTGVTAYLDTMYVNIQSDPFYQKYTRLDSDLEIDEDDMPF